MKRIIQWKQVGYFMKNTGVKIQLKLQFGHFFILNLKKKILKHKQFNNVNNFLQYTQAVKEKKSPR